MMTSESVTVYEDMQVGQALEGVRALERAGRREAA